MTEQRAILKEEDPRRWALKAALQDSEFLISPRARDSALEILKDDNTPEGKAGRLVLTDGKAQQEGTRFSASLDEWARAVEVLEGANL